MFLVTLHPGIYKDEALIEGIALYKETEGWDRVAEHVGRGVTAVQCMGRWRCSIYVRDGEKLKQEPWTEEEVVGILYPIVSFSY